MNTENKASEDSPPPMTESAMVAMAAEGLAQIRRDGRDSEPDADSVPEPQVEPQQSVAADDGAAEDRALDGVDEPPQDQSEHSGGADAPSSALQRAETALDKAGLGPEFREGKSPEQVIAMGKAVAARQAEQQRETQRIVEERNRLAAEAGAKGPEQGTPEAAARVRELLAKQFPDEEVDALSEALSLMVSEAGPANEAARRNLAETEILRVRQEMASADSALSQDEVWAPLIPEANALLGIPGRYDGADDPIKAAFVDAAKLAGRADTSAPNLNGASPTRPTKRTSKPATNMARDELNGEILRRKRAGHSMREIRAWMERG